MGKGHDRRAWSQQGRNKFWKRVVQKHGLDVEIYLDGLQEWYAFELEKDLVGYYGRRQLGLGSLVNLSDGGEGPSGIICSEDRRKEISMQTKGKLNPNIDPRIWEFLNVKSNTTIAATKYEMTQMYPDLSMGALFCKTFTHKGWTVVGLTTEHSISVLKYGRGGLRNANANKTKYEWINIFTKEEILCSPIELKEMFPHVIPNNIITHGHRYTKDWTLKSIYQSIDIEHLIHPRRGEKAGFVDHTVYTFRNVLTNEIFTGKRINFEKQYGIKLNALFRKDRTGKTVKNWEIVN